MKIKYKDKVLNVTGKKVSGFGFVRGLMFRDKETQNLIFEFKNGTNMGIHSFFVKFPFLAVWLDEKNNVIKFKFVKPFRFPIKPSEPFYKLIEIPLNKRNKRIVDFLLERKTKKPVDKRKI